MRKHTVLYLGISWIITVLLFSGCRAETVAEPVAVVAGKTCEIVVDCSEEIGPATHRAAGILHSIEVDAPPDEMVLPLNLRAFRGRPNDKYLFSDGFYDRLKRIGIEHVQVVVSDAYGYPNGLFGWPGDNNDWGWWEHVVTEAVRGCQKRNMNVEYDIWNEPNIQYFWGKDQESWRKTWCIGFRKIRQLDKKAVIVGPSISGFGLEYLDEFLSFAKENGCLPDILSWHELGSVSGRQIPEHVRQAKELLTSKGIDIRRFSINEIVPAHCQFSPGTAVCYFANIERTSVESACHSCWGDVVGNNGENASLDGMLTHDTKRPRSCWWAYKCYGDMAGKLFQVARKGEPTPRIDGLACYDSEAAIAQVLVGSYEKERRMDVALTFLNVNKARGLSRWNKVRVIAERIPSTGTEPLEKPIPVLDEKMSISDNTLTVTLPALAPDEAYSVRLSKP